MSHRYRRTHSFRSSPYPKVTLKPEFEILAKVQAQTGFRKDLIFLQTSGSADSPYTFLQNAIDYIGSMLKVVRMGEPAVVIVDDRELCIYKYVLSIDDEILVDGRYISETLAKKGLAEMAVKELQRKCFTIVRKFHPSDIPAVPLIPSTDKPSGSTSTTNVLSETPLKGGIGEKIMKEMGWGGAGLGVQEQGRVDTIQAYIQIERKGFGAKDIEHEVIRVLQQHAASDSINSISFSTDFSKEERCTIHKIARKLNLKSRSYGQGVNRTLVVQSKKRLIDLLRVLLSDGGENEQYAVVFPTDYEK